jgi:hypothetical protein
MLDEVTHVSFELSARLSPTEPLHHYRRVACLIKTVLVACAP